MLTKQGLLSQLSNAKNNYLLGLAAISLLQTPEGKQHLNQSRAAFGPYVVSFEEVAHLLGSESDWQLAFKEFLTMLLRALLKESFQLVKDYSHQTRQVAELERQSWYHFARLLRNGLSHDFHFRFSKFDRMILPVIWRGKMIDSKLDDRPMEIGLLGYDGAWELFCEIEGFAARDLR